LLDQTREKYLTLEARTKQLQTEADILRRWRAEMMDSMAGLIQQREQLAEEVLEAVAGSCSNDCWRQGIRRTRAFIVLQTLAGLFAGVGDTVDLVNDMGACTV
jgi:recombinational DNA repair ATPase RecF